MKYAVIRLADQQFKVKEGDILDVNLLSDAKKSLVVKDVLLFADGDKVEIGKPTLANVVVKAKVLEPDWKGPKLKIMRFKAKSRYRKRKGHRQRYTRLEITSITVKK